MHFLFNLINDFFQSPGLSIIFIAFLFQLFITPISIFVYNKKQGFSIVTKKLKKNISELKGKYKGGELNQHIFNLYKINGSNYIYKSFDILLLLIQIPFLLLVYFFIIENLYIFNTHFLFLSNLSQPDSLINIYFFESLINLNLLPLSLLFLYVIDAIYYQKFFSFPMLFSIVLIILIYNFPSSLLLFWFFFYFFKNIFNLFCTKFISISYRVN